MVRAGSAAGVVAFLSPGNDIQGTLNANPEGGTTFVLTPGTHRITEPLDPKNNQTLLGQYGAVLSGSVVLTGWTQSGSDWWVPRPAGASAEMPDDPGDGARCAITGCENPNDVFYNGTPLVRVASQVALTSGTFFEDFTLGRVYIRDDPNLALVEQAVSERLIQSSNNNVTIRNLVLQHAANGAQDGAVQWTGTGWEVEYNEVRYNHGIGIRMDGSGFNVHHNEIHHQMQMGYGGDGSNGFFEYNHVHHNNRDFSYLMLWEAGGGKHAVNSNVKVRYNHSHDNNGPGLWADINCSDFDFAGNYVHDNAHYGIFYELSYAELTLGDGKKSYLRHNVSFDNRPDSATGFFSGGQIVVSATRGPVEVYGNVARGQDGIGGLAQVRVDHPDPAGRGDHTLHDLHVYDNDVQAVWDGVGFCNIAGIQTDDPAQTNSVYTDAGNTFEGNHYYRASAIGDSWTWIEDFNTFAQWQALGHDLTGTETIDGAVTIPPAPSLDVGPR